MQYTLALFAVFPLAAIIRLLPSTSLKHLYSMLLGIFLVQWIFGADWGHFLISSAVTYLLCAVVPKKYVHVVVFVWAMGYMTMAHMYRMYVSYMSGIFDFTGTQVGLLSAWILVISLMWHDIVRNDMKWYDMIWTCRCPSDGTHHEADILRLQPPRRYGRPQASLR